MASKLRVVTLFFPILSLGFSQYSVFTSYFEFASFSARLDHFMLPTPTTIRVSLHLKTL
ncbi:hypothetical protein ACODM8_01285 [Vibrio ostreicida]|uniref:Uncharacterized protein n=1 Tax=Vibrio ostreicida TaxID=526588 RepID=A0ABT8BU36_9VIBR|nr:hypothetical protein [Vibrio ostreicida]MDN3609899.1 hypothetical protein [Vibrio ostreicida]NPD10018.1 hypothetical protein [Vibrio ostreicida]